MRERTEELIRAYSLEAHPEGGYFAEMFTAEGSAKGRNFAGSIYFLLGAGDISHFHQIDCEEIWFFHEGCGLTVHILAPDGSYRRELLGNDLSRGQKPMVVVEKGAIFAAENVTPEGYTFLSCVTTPRFLYEGFRLVPAEELKDKNLPERLFLG